MHAVTLLVDGQMRMSAEDVIDVSRLGVRQGAVGHLLRKPQPARIQPIQAAGELLVLGIHFLDAAEEQFSGTAQKNIVERKAIELMPVDCQVALPVIGPHVALKNGNSYKVGHDVRQSLIVVAFDPHDFDLPLTIGELANVGEKLPVLAVQAAKVQVREDVAQENEPAVATGFQQR